LFEIQIIVDKMSLKNLADTLNRNKTSNFDDIIATAKQSEKKNYSIANGQSLFLIKRRDKNRLHLVCKNGKKVGCNFSIVYWLTNCITMQEFHSCSFSDLLKYPEKVQAQTQQKFEQSLINPPPSTSDFIWSSSVLSQNSNYKSCTTQESQLQPISTIVCREKPLFEQTLINPPPSTSDFIWSSSVLSQNSNYESCTTQESQLQPIPTIVCRKIAPEEPVVPLTSTDSIDSRMLSSIPSSLTTFGDDNSSILTPQRPKIENSIINLSADDKYQKYTDNIISIVDTNDYTAEKKLLLTNRVKEMLKCQFGFQFFSDIFNSYSPHERDNMIIQLQMLNCLKKASEKPYLKLKMPIFPETTPSLKRYKKTDLYDYEENEDGDEITYHD
jgi:hypothetical protein